MDPRHKCFAKISPGSKVLKPLRRPSVPLCYCPENFNSGDLPEAQSCIWPEKSSSQCILFLYDSSPHSQVTPHIPIIELDTEYPDKEAGWSQWNEMIFVMSSLISELNLSAGKVYWLMFQSLVWICIFDNKCLRWRLYNSLFFPFPLTGANLLFIVFPVMGKRIWNYPSQPIGCLLWTGKRIKKGISGG